MFSAHCGYFTSNVICSITNTHSLPAEGKKITYSVKFGVILEGLVYNFVLCGCKDEDRWQ
jgi:hypothetical protein